MFSCFLAMVIKGNKFPFSTILTQIMYTQMYFAKSKEKNIKFAARSELSRYNLNLNIKVDLPLYI